MRAIGIILAGGNSNRMKELSKKRAVCAMPVAGSYRSIDFALSNMEFSRVSKVAILTQYNSRSLNEHLASSKWWDFGRKQGGMFLFTPSFADANSQWYRGTADAIAQSLTVGAMLGEDGRRLVRRGKTILAAAAGELRGHIGETLLHSHLGRKRRLHVSHLTSSRSSLGIGEAGADRLQLGPAHSSASLELIGDSSSMATIRLNYIPC